MKLSFCSGAPVVGRRTCVLSWLRYTNPSIVAQSPQPLGIGNPWEDAVCGEHRGGRRGAGGERGTGVLADAGGGGGGTAILVEAGEVEPEPLGALPEMRVVEPALVCVERIG